MSTDVATAAAPCGASAGRSALGQAGRHLGDF